MKKCVDTVFFGQVCDNGDGASIILVLNTIITIMTIGVGILAVVGVIYSGAQYLTAGDKEDQVKKAKRRIVEIIIGLAAYALLYALLYWLLPEFRGV